MVITLFEIVKNWNQPIYPSMGERINCGIQWTTTQQEKGTNYQMLHESQNNAE